jgi:small nuclear ribonucleoprotein (snRNP)-like protein
MLTAIVIPADPDHPVRLEQLDRNDLDAYRRLVGGNLEVINLERPMASLYLNEEGKLIELPLNPRATVLLWAHNSAFRGEDIIVGDAFIVGPPDRRGDDTTAPDELVQLLFHTERYRVLVRTQGDKEFYGNLRTFDSWFEAYVYGVRSTTQRRGRTTNPVRSSLRLTICSTMVSLLRVQCTSLPA